MKTKSSRRAWLLGGVALLAGTWMALLGTGILAPDPIAAPAPLSTASVSGPGAATPAASPPSARSAQANPSAAPDAPTGTVATRILVEELGIDLPIYEGDGYTAELGMAAHYPTTSWPGGGSLTYLYAHARDDNFVALWDAELGDIIELELDDGSTVSYSVSRIVPDVRWNDMSWLDPTPGELLRLQTCNSYEETAPRFIVEATPIRSGP